ncbi:PDZ domain-containing RING finger protein 4 [Salvelinus namaycush]|uniref:PDZ domain-containing RING finger protein 4 n=1 Tax=Salvelinus namaycush TaxID=8040 RepID=A0A8U0QCR2_SALNM|nr:PDZ domain-containing RING finger protein 4 [Salvelinus namaycush]
MGCNLCTLQKREEHYKLLYEIAQVNGRDYSKASHDEVVEVIRRDPIVVQVVRRHGNPAHSHQTLQEVHVVDVCTQTDITFEHIMALAKLRPATPPVPDICPFLLSDSCHSIHTMEHEFYECPEYLSNTPAEVDRPEEFEYEQVELCRLNSQEKLGLTLCYRTDDEEDTAIYVSHVGPNSIAARDGRIREGDRILQINGCDVQDRQEAFTLLSNEESRSIVLLVTRPEEAWLDEEHNELLEGLKMEILEERRNEEMQKTGGGEEQAKQLEEDDVMTDTATCSSNTQDKDSGLGTGRNEESSEQEVLLARVHRRPAQGLRDRWRAKHGQGLGRRVVVPSDTQGPRGLIQAQEGEGGVGLGLECDSRFQQLLELKCQIRNSGECGVYYSRRSTIECSLTEQSGVGVSGGGGMEQELRMLNEELRSIELECQSIMQAHQLRKNQRDPPCTPMCSPGRSPKHGREQHAKLADINEHPGEKQWDSDKLRGDKDSSSAYNTAESARSTPLGMERSPDHSLQRRISLTNQKNLRSTMAASGQSISIHIPDRELLSETSTGTPTHSRQDPNPSPGTTVISSSPDQSNPSPSESDPALPADDERCDRTRSYRGPRRVPPYPSPYHTAPQQGQGASPAHARHLQSYMQQLLQQTSSLETYSQSQLSLLSVCRDRSTRPGEPRLEWKVKVRADGTKYVARRPARDRILRERALRIREERSGGMTTDDDAMSEMKMGRYWSKEERKQQLARAREQRRRREYMQRNRLECLREGPGSGAEGRKEVNILELSHKKMMKKRNKKILDNWMTIQELMSHGARAPEDQGTKPVHNAFLSVTTV